MSGDYDALVIGGGPAGSTAALLLARAGWRVAIVEKAVFPRRKVCGEFISATTWALLDALDIADALLPRAGPAVTRIGVFAGHARITAELPSLANSGDVAGRALGREHLDSALLERAVATGAERWQPWSLTAFEADRDGVRCVISERGTGKMETLAAGVLVAAHGAWESGVLPTQGDSRSARPDDLLGFKSHFRNAALPVDLMPLLAFPGGYGGLVNSDDGRLSLSCCVRRDALAVIREQWPGRKAGAALLVHIVANCPGAADALANAAPDGAWLAAGPLRTGVRSFGTGRILAIGNAAAEAHPIVAEGISMAIQSAHLASAALVAPKSRRLDNAQIAAIRRSYEAAWRRNFSRRVYAAALFAHVFMRPATAAIAVRMLRGIPGLLTLGARWSGKNSLLQNTNLPAFAPESHR